MNSPLNIDYRQLAGVVPLQQSLALQGEVIEAVVGIDDLRQLLPCPLGRLRPRQVTMLAHLGVGMGMLGKQRRRMLLPELIGLGQQFIGDGERVIVEPTQRRCR